MPVIPLDTGPVSDADPADAAAPRLFLLRVWRRPAGFRVALREVGGDGVAQFRTSVELLRYVNAIWRAGSSAGEEPSPGVAASPAAAPPSQSPARAGLEPE